MRPFIKSIFFVIFFFVSVRGNVNAASEQDQVSSLPKLGISAQEGITDYWPLVWVAPQFPRKAVSAHIWEGYVIVSTTVTKKGTTVGCEIIEASPQGYGFEEAACKAMRFAKYRPKKGGDGNPIEVKNVKWRYIFANKK